MKVHFHGAGAAGSPGCSVHAAKDGNGCLGDAEIIPIDSLTAQKRLVEAGFGLGLMPASSVEEELRVGTLRALRIAAMHMAVPVVLVHRRRAYLSGAARALMALLAARPSRARS